MSMFPSTFPGSGGGDWRDGCAPIIWAIVVIVVMSILIEKGIL